MPVERHPVAALCELLDLTEEQVYALADAGVIPKPRRNGWDLIECSRAYARHLRDLSPPHNAVSSAQEPTTTSGAGPAPTSRLALGTPEAIAALRELGQLGEIDRHVAARLGLTEQKFRTQLYLPENADALAALREGRCQASAEVLRRAWSVLRTGDDKAALSAAKWLAERIDARPKEEAQGLAELLDDLGQAPLSDENLVAELRGRVH